MRGFKQLVAADVFTRGHRWCRTSVTRSRG
jgi:hypothetical protein